MSAPRAYTIEYDIKGEPRKFRCGSRQLRDFRDGRRKVAVRLAVHGGRDAARIVAERIRHCVRSIRNWIGKWNVGGNEALNEKSRAPKNAKKLDDERIAKILDIRDRHGYGCSKIAFDAQCSSSTVHKYLRANERKMASKSRTRFRRFERKHSNSMWQLDYTMLRGGVWVLQVVDDHSRFIVGARTMTTPNVSETMELLETCFSKYGVPDQFLTDHGTQFYSGCGGVSEFDRFCLERMIHHILESIAHPQTLGKTEQRHNMLKDHLDKHLGDTREATREAIDEAVRKFVDHHNYDSPHEGWLEYRIGDWVKRKKVHFLPFMRFANDRKYMSGE